MRPTQHGVITRIAKHTTARHYVLHNDLLEPTRHGNSVERDTSPDLTFATAGLQVRWSNTREHLGSDHNIILLEVDFTPPRIKWRQQHITDWDKMRKDRIEVKAADITEWTEQIQQCKKKHTKSPTQHEGEPATDKHLLHCWEAREALIKRWKRNKTNRSLRKRISELNAHIQDYTNQLLKKQWTDLCNSLQGQLSVKKTWQLIRHLLNPTTSKNSNTQKIAQLINEHDDPQKLLEELKMKYIPQSDNPKYENYNGPENEVLDEPFTLSELKSAMQDCKHAKTPGPDQITNPCLRNLSDEDQEWLLQQINNIWKGKTPLPPEWKTGTMIFIPKPGKAINTSNLRPITLTSNVGKLLERMVLRRLQNHLEEHQHIPFNLLGFRPKLSTQDILLALYEEV